jgi:hypothetical protein
MKYELIVEELAKLVDDVSDEMALARLAKEHSNATIRRMAISIIRDTEILRNISTSDLYTNAIRLFAAVKIRDQAIIHELSRRIIFNPPSEEESYMNRTALKNMTISDLDILYLAAEKGSLKAFEKIQRLSSDLSPHEVKKTTLVFLEK